MRLHYEFTYIGVERSEELAIWLELNGVGPSGDRWEVMVWDGYAYPLKRRLCEKLIDFKVRRSVSTILCIFAS